MATTFHGRSVSNKNTPFERQSAMAAVFSRYRTAASEACAILQNFHPLHRVRCQLKDHKDHLLAATLFFSFFVICSVVPVWGWRGGEGRGEWADRRRESSCSDEQGSPCRRALALSVVHTRPTAAVVPW
ncbi:hypothetical protein L209DRAFT_409607 [Thermothelomyces heterothallicus CBS 203.75]